MENGGPAFPSDRKIPVAGVPSSHWQEVVGMSLRDYFAGQAIMGMMANTFIATRGKPLDENVSVQEFFATGAYEFADAMLAERVK